MCLYSTPSCHRAQSHCDISISHSCVTLGVCGCPDASLTWFYLFKHHTLRAAVGHTPNPAWHASHQIWVLAASFVFNWSLGWLMSKPTVNLWPPQQGDSTIPSLSLSLATPVLTKSWFIWLFIYFNNPPPHCLPSFLSLFISFLFSAPLCHAGHHITTSNQSLSKQQTLFLVNCCASAKRCGVVKMFLWWSVDFCGLLP